MFNGLHRSKSLPNLIKIEVRAAGDVGRHHAEAAFSTTAVVFICWTLGLSLLLFGVAIIFMRNQIRPIRKLASAADDFGKVVKTRPSDPRARPRFDKRPGVY